MDESALAEAVREGAIAGAAVDCFVREPLPANHPFYELPNFILTPHMSGVYDGLWPALVNLLAENLMRLGTGRTLLNRADGRLGY